MQDYTLPGIEFLIATHAFRLVGAPFHRRLSEPCKPLVINGIKTTFRSRDYDVQFWLTPHVVLLHATRGFRSRDASHFTPPHVAFPEPAARSSENLTSSHGNSKYFLPFLTFLCLTQRRKKTARPTKIMKPVGRNLNFIPYLCNCKTADTRG